MRQKLLATVLLAGALSACKASSASQPAQIDLTHFIRVDNAPELTLTKIGSLTLGAPNQGVYEVTDLEIDGGEHYVVDLMAKAVHVFDGSGRLLRTIGRPGPGPGEFKMPVSVVVTGAEVIVLDPSHGKNVSAFAKDGRFIEMREIDVPTTPVSIVMMGDRMVSMGGGITDPARQGWDVLGITDSDGKRVGQGCRIDERYIESTRSDGMINHFGWGSVSVHGNRIYCIQTISPVVQVMDSLGQPLEQIRLAPPFYAPPVERPATLNQKAIFEYMTTFTGHSEFYAVENGFVSVYSRFDEGAGEVRYDLFVCDTSAGAKCGVVRGLRKPHVRSLNSVYIVEETAPDAPIQLGIYRISSPGRR